MRRTELDIEPRTTVEACLIGFLRDAYRTNDELEAAYQAERNLRLRAQGYDIEQPRP